MKKNSNCQLKDLSKRKSISWYKQTRNTKVWTTLNRKSRHTKRQDIDIWSLPCLHRGRGRLGRGSRTVISSSWDFALHFSHLSLGSDSVWCLLHFVSISALRLGSVLLSLADGTVVAWPVDTVLSSRGRRPHSSLDCHWLGAAIPGLWLVQPTDVCTMSSPVHSRQWHHPPVLAGVGMYTVHHCTCVHCNSLIFCRISLTSILNEATRPD